MPRYRLVIGALLTALSASCGHPSTPENTPAAVVAEPTPPPSVATAAVPATLRPDPLWQAPFSSPPRAVDDMFVGLIHPTPAEPKLTVAGVDAEGRTRWVVHTNPSCANFGISRAGDRNVVVVLDQEPGRSGDVVAHTVASGYDAEDGTRVWGPVQVPGQLVGPGLLVSRGGGPDGPRAALDSHSGRVVVESQPGTTVLQEYNGTVLVDRERKLLAIDARDGAERWGPAALLAPDSVAGQDARPRYRSAASGDPRLFFVEWVVGDDDRVVGHSIHDMHTGALVTDVPEGGGDAMAVADRATNKVVVYGISGTGTVFGVDRASRDLLWRRPVDPEPVTFSFASQGIAYGTTGSRAVAVDERSGEVRAEGTWAPPVAATRSGITLVPVPGGKPDETRFVAFEKR
ncbi:hypothetical protein GCM10012275_35380 [Longimycelium tulufanense]|uniref:Uncharacterized protein n=1 Tax=Longimycelium tulufanense TaxID=907463 RepID=A0A8J3FXD4_9PSEU|nr:PQQ-binding-like beta-propeller repeat protein [Longimycelium tulufanense]GGM61294.1 hypothetical protein GCM10012275_35380 [Longimycelium tulufanense]